MKNLYKFYYFFNLNIVQWGRVGAFLAIGIVVYLNIKNTEFILRLLPFYFILIVQELFIYFKLNNSQPMKTIEESINESIDFRVRMIIDQKGVVKGIIKLKGSGEVKSFLNLLSVDFSIDDLQISKEDLLNRSLEIVRGAGGKYIHAIDIYAAYLLMAEEKQRLLFNNEIETNDVFALVAWIRKEYGYDKHIQHRINFSGNGVFDSLVYGWSAETSRYALNFTNEILKHGEIVPIGRDKEYDLLVTALSKSSSSNVLLVGDPGVGKTSIVSKFAIDSHTGSLPSYVSNKVVFQLFAERILAGIDNQGDLESRFVALLEELSHSGNIVLYIPNIENIFGGGGINLDLSGMLSEYLKSNRITFIGTTTEASYQTYIYPKQELRDLLDVVQIEEPPKEKLLFMMLEKRKELVYQNGIQVSFKALKETIDLSTSYLSDGTALPGRAVRLLEDVISHAKTHGEKKIDRDQVRAFVEQKVHVVLSKPSSEESNRLLKLEEDIHKRIVSQDEAVKAVSSAMRRVRSGMKEENRPIASFLFLGPTGVGKTETAKALASIYFGSADSMIRLDMSEYQNQDSIERLLGSQDTNEYVDSLSNKVLNNPFSLLLLDEFEKSHPKILDLFLQILDEGRLTDNTGRTISFTNTIIIATSNAGSELIRENLSDKEISEEEKRALIENILKGNIFKPELVNRFDDVIVFKPLNRTDIMEIADHFMKQIGEKLAEQHITLRYDRSVLEFIANASYSAEFGARNVRRFIEQAVENHISTKLLEQALIPGGVAIITVNNNAISVSVG